MTNKLGLAVTLAPFALLALSGRSVATERQEIFGAWAFERIGVAPPEFITGRGFPGRVGTFDGLLGGFVELADNNSYAAYFEIASNELTILDDWPGSGVGDISDNGFIGVDVLGNEVVLPAVVLVDSTTGRQEGIRSGDGFHEGPHVNSFGEIAFYNNTDGVWVWPQMVNLPIGEGFDPKLIDLGLIDAELGLVSIYGFSDEGWVTGSITINGALETHAFMWNFHTDELFRLRDSQFEGDTTRATAIDPDGWAIVEVNASGSLGQSVDAAFRWDGTSLEPLDPSSAIFVGRFPMVDVNASGQAVGGDFVRINDEGQVLLLGRDRIFDPDCQCERDVVTLSRGDPLHIDGDYDASGKVDQGDLDLVLLHWGGDVLPDDWYHDFPDLPIDQAELDTVLLRWGRTDGTPVLPVSGGVPEPASLTMILFGLATIALARPITSRRRSPRLSAR